MVEAADGFAGGRLDEYLDEGQTSRIDELAIEVHASLEAIENLSRSGAAEDPFGFLLELKRSPLLEF